VTASITWAGIYSSSNLVAHSGRHLLVDRQVGDVGHCDVRAIRLPTSIGFGNRTFVETAIEIRA
jgi:hypothetical protein